MYEVSEEYIKALITSPIYSYISGTMKLKDGTIIDISEDFIDGTATIARHSLSISNQCISQSDLEFGAVQVGELDCNLYTNIASEKIKEAVITLDHNLKVNGAFVPVPLGVFNVDEAPRTKKYIKITAYDNMFKLDKEYDGTTTEGNIYDILLFIADETGIELAQTKEEIEALTNGDRYIRLKENNNFSTFRDIVSYIACEMAAFATINRAGKLEFRQFKTTPALTINEDIRSDTETGEDITNYDAIRITMNNKTYVRIATGLKEAKRVLTVPDNPLISDGNSDTYIIKTIQAMADELYKINYKAASFKTLNNPALDLGDMITLTDASGKTLGDALVMKCEFNNHGSMAIKSLSNSEKISTAKSSYEKVVSGVAAQNETIETTVNAYTNAKAYTLNTTSKKIISIDYTAKKDTSGNFNATILMNVKGIPEPTATAAADGTIKLTIPTAMLKLRINVNKEYDLLFMPQQTLKNGRQIITITYPVLNIKQNTVNNISVWAEIDDGSADIEAQEIKASISASGLTGYTQEWDGNINIDETFDGLIITDIICNKFNDTFIVKQQQPRSATFAENYNGLVLSDIKLAGMTETIIFNEIVTKNTIETAKAKLYNFNREFVEAGEAFKLRNNYTYAAVEEEIDAGRMEAIQLDFTKFESVESVTING